jgi:hypothetical protein
MEVLEGTIGTDATEGTTASVRRTGACTDSGLFKLWLLVFWTLWLLCGIAGDVRDCRLIERGIEDSSRDECCGKLATKESNDDVDDTAATGLVIPSFSDVLFAIVSSPTAIDEPCGSFMLTFKMKVPVSQSCSNNSSFFDVIAKVCRHKLPSRKRTAVDKNNSKNHNCKHTCRMMPILPHSISSHEMIELRL